jgi:hypothetical protein
MKIMWDIYDEYQNANGDRLRALFGQITKRNQP